MRRSVVGLLFLAGLTSLATAAVRRPAPEEMAQAAAEAARAAATGQPPASTAAAPRLPVLVELFTSEGCSSCPPADTLLSRMIAEQPLPGVEIVGLGFHVDYWDRLGWRDRYSSSAYSARQNDYAVAWRTDNVFTPQTIVDGAQQCVGSDWPAVQKLIRQAAATPKLPVTIDLAPDAAGPGGPSVRITVQPAAARPANASAMKGDVLIAVAQDGLVSDVQRGENAKMRLAHVAVVRSIEKVGRFDGERPYSATSRVAIDKAWPRDALKVIVLVQDSASRRVLGVASHRLPR